MAGQLSYANPNYDFLGNSLNYTLASEKNDKPDQGYENSIISGSIGTSFEQYKDVIASLGLSFSHDDLRTLDMLQTLKKQKDLMMRLQQITVLHLIKEIELSCRQGINCFFRQSLPVYADKSFWSNTFSASTYKSFNEDIVGASKFYLAAVNGLGSDDVRLSKRKGLSSKRLRGFERNKIGPVDGSDHIGGNYAAALNFEANLLKILPEDTNTDLSLFLMLAMFGV